MFQTNVSVEIFLGFSGENTSEIRYEDLSGRSIILMTSLPQGTVAIMANDVPNLLHRATVSLATPLIIRSKARMCSCRRAPSCVHCPLTIVACQLKRTTHIAAVLLVVPETHVALLLQRQWPAARNSPLLVCLPCCYRRPSGRGAPRRLSFRRCMCQCLRLPSCAPLLGPPRVALPYGVSHTRLSRGRAPVCRPPRPTRRRRPPCLWRRRTGASQTRWRPHRRAGAARRLCPVDRSAGRGRARRSGRLRSR